MDGWDGRRLLPLADAFGQDIEGTVHGGTIIGGSPLSLGKGTKLEQDNTQEELHTINCAQRVTWKMVNTRWLASGATQHQGL